MNEDLEILLFDIEEIYKSVHQCARDVCALRGIGLREFDLASNAELAMKYQVRHFPQCLLLRNGHIIGETHYITHSPKTFDNWIEKSLNDSAQDRDRTG